jgi:Mn-dependent DtxR family transcriptional regulator
MTLSDSQRRILEFIALADGEGCVLAHDIAAELDVSPRSMGGRLMALEQRDLVRRIVVKKRASFRSDQLHGWQLTRWGLEAIK